MQADHAHPDVPAPPPKGQGGCEAALCSGDACRWKAKGVYDGERLCGVHLRQRTTCTECPVCLMAIKKRVMAEMSCGHKFHTKCIRAWYRKRPLTCPMCRQVCLEGMGLLGARLAPKLQALVRTVPPAPGAFFPSYIVVHLRNPEVQAALGATDDLIDMLVDIACECFTRDNFFAKVRGMTL